MKLYKKTKNKTKNKTKKQIAGASYASQQNYEPIILHMDNTEGLIKMSREFANLFMTYLISDREKSKNFWIRKIITNRLPSDCLGNPNTKDYMQVNKKDLMHTINLVSQILKDNKLYVKDIKNNSDIRDDTNIEVHFAKADKTPVGSGLTVHVDNDGEIEGALHTLIVYLDIDCHGGMLGIYDNTGTNKLYDINPKSEIENQTKVVMFNGGMYHCPTPITNGTRLVVTYQIRQKETIGGSESRKSYKFKSYKSKSCTPFEANILEYGKHHGVA